MKKGRQRSLEKERGTDLRSYFTPNMNKSFVYRDYTKKGGDAIGIQDVPLMMPKSNKKERHKLMPSTFENPTISKRLKEVNGESFPGSLNKTINNSPSSRKINHTSTSENATNKSKILRNTYNFTTISS